MTFQPGGLITLFDGQKQYPVAKASVDFLFVEHVQYNCIEIIGVCVQECAPCRSSIGTAGNFYFVTSLNDHMSLFLQIDSQMTVFGIISLPVFS